MAFPVLILSNLQSGSEHRILKTQGITTGETSFIKLNVFY